MKSRDDAPLGARSLGHIALRGSIRDPSAPGRAAAREVRLLGDEERGFILAGVADLLEGVSDEFWFSTLAEAVSVGELLGIDRADWEDLSAGP